MSVQKPDLQAKRELGQGAGVEPLAGAQPPHLLP
jgi:hypothetical protein